MTLCENTIKYLKKNQCQFLPNFPKTEEARIPNSF